MASAGSKFWCNFSALGFNPGFGLSVSLRWSWAHSVPPSSCTQVGSSWETREALRLGVCHRLAEDHAVRDEAINLAGTFAASAPLAIRSIKGTLRGALAEQVRSADEHELSEQALLRRSRDFHERVRAIAQRRRPNFAGE